MKRIILVATVMLGLIAGVLGVTIPADEARADSPSSMRRTLGCRGSYRGGAHIRSLSIVILLAAALFMSIVPAQLAQAYTVQYGHFSPPTGYWVTSSRFPYGWVTPAINATNAWTNVSNCDFSWVRDQYLGALYKNTLDAYIWGNAQLALTSYSYNGTTISNLHIRMNTYFTWSTSGAPNAYDVQNALTHEFGHGLPLGHSSYVSATMYAYTSLGETLKRSLYFDDIDGIRAIY